MPAIKIDKFGAMLPKLSDHQLPDHMASLAENTWLDAGVLESMGVPRLVHTCASNSTLSVFRLPLVNNEASSMEASHWMEFDYPDVKVLRNPLSDDSYHRYYWCGETGAPPRYNTKARILSGLPPYKLGVPAPSSAPTLTLPGAGTPVTRAYVVTYVSAFGEEGPPSVPVTGTADSGSAWTINLPSPSGADTTDRNLAFKRIYRTVTSGAGVATYFRLTQVPIGDASFADSTLDSLLVTQPQLESSFWTEPPSDLEGWVMMSNGMVAGFVKQQLWFCEPYRMHAWPASYQLNTAYDIIGLGVVGQTCIICTDVETYAATGINPGAMTLSTISSSEPCTSRGSIVSMQGGVFYSSPNGLIMASPSGLQNVTHATIGERRWRAMHNIYRLRAASMGDAYYMFGRWGGAAFQADAFQADLVQGFDGGTSTEGAMLSFSEQAMPYTRITTDKLTSNVLSDIWTDEVLVLRQHTDNTVGVYHICISERRPPGTYVWRTKKFSAQKKHNFAAAKVSYEVPEGQLNYSCTIRVYADGRMIFERLLPASGVVFRLPSGYKADEWQFEFEGDVKINDIHIAGSARELASA
jgi:hypothetical protein